MSATLESPQSVTSSQAAAHTPVVTSQWRMVWRRFRQHRLALIASIIVVCFYIVVLLPGFFAYADPESSEAARSLIPPQPIHLFHDGSFSPHVYALEQTRNMSTFELEYTPNPDERIPIEFFSKGFEYKLFGLIPTDRHLIGLEGVDAVDGLFLLGTDQQGRDMWSRIIYGTQVSLSIGLISVVMSLVLGIVLGGISGYFGGTIDTVIQRIIEVLVAIPTIPLWMGLAAALPRDWSILKIYFAMTIIISFLGWTELARVVRGRFLSLRHEDFVMAARVTGCGQARIIIRHMVPSFLSHIIAATTLALPAMIISETSLSFLGLGLRPPAISWGVLLQQAQNIQSIATTPWLLIPAIPVILAVISFNFIGDGLRDAADPYAQTGK